MLPTIPTGEVRQLLVVAVSNHDKVIPVLRIKLKFTNEGANEVKMALCTDILMVILSPAISKATVSCVLMHDSGDENGYTVFKSRIAEPTPSTDSRVITSWSMTDTRFNDKDITISNIVVTPEDVKRGYIVWDWDLRNLGVPASGKEFYFRIREISFAKQ